MYIPGNHEDSFLNNNKFIQSKVSHKNDTLAPKFPYLKLVFISSIASQLVDSKNSSFLIGPKDNSVTWLRVGVASWVEKVLNLEVFTTIII